MEARSENEAKAVPGKGAIAKDLLKQYAGTKVETRNILEYIERLKHEDIRSGTSHAEEYMRQIAPRIQANKQLMDRLEQAAQKIPDPLERSILEMRYLNVSTCRLTGWNTVALNLYHRDDARTTRAVFHLHDRALRSLSAILESGCEQ